MGALKDFLTGKSSGSTGESPSLESVDNELDFLDNKLTAVKRSPGNSFISGLKAGPGSFFSGLGNLASGASNLLESNAENIFKLGPIGGLKKTFSDAGEGIASVGSNLLTTPKGRRALYGMVPGIGPITQFAGQQIEESLGTTEDMPLSQEMFEMGRGFGENITGAGVGGAIGAVSRATGPLASWVKTKSLNASSDLGAPLNRLGVPGGRAGRELVTDSTDINAAKKLYESNVLSPDSIKSGSIPDIDPLTGQVKYSTRAPITEAERGVLQSNFPALYTKQNLIVEKAGELKRPLLQEIDIAFNRLDNGSKAALTTLDAPINGEAAKQIKSISELELGKQSPIVQEARRIIDSVRADTSSRIFPADAPMNRALPASTVGSRPLGILEADELRRNIDTLLRSTKAYEPGAAGSLSPIAQQALREIRNEIQDKINNVGDVLGPEIGLDINLWRNLNTAQSQAYRVMERMEPSLTTQAQSMGPKMFSETQEAAGPFRMVAESTGIPEITRNVLNARQMNQATKGAVMSNQMVAQNQGWTPKPGPSGFSPIIGAGAGVAAAPILTQLPRDYGILSSQPEMLLMAAKQEALKTGDMGTIQVGMEVVKTLQDPSKSEDEKQFTLQSFMQLAPGMFESAPMGLSSYMHGTALNLPDRAKLQGQINTAPGISVKEKAESFSNSVFGNFMPPVKPTQLNQSVMSNSIPTSNFEDIIMTPIGGDSFEALPNSQAESETNQLISRMQNNVARRF